MTCGTWWIWNAAHSACLCALAFCGGRMVLAPSAASSPDAAPAARQPILPAQSASAAPRLCQKAHQLLQQQARAQHLPWHLVGQACRLCWAARPGFASQLKSALLARLHHRCQHQTDLGPAARHQPLHAQLHLLLAGWKPVLCQGGSPSAPCLGQLHLQTLHPQCLLLRVLQWGPVQGCQRWTRLGLEQLLDLLLVLAAQGWGWQPEPASAGPGLLLGRTWTGWSSGTGWEPGAPSGAGAETPPMQHLPPCTAAFNL